MANCAQYEPSIDEILADPAVKALMLAGGVNPGRLRSRMLRLGAANGQLETKGSPRESTLSVFSGARGGATTARAVRG